MYVKGKNSSDKLYFNFDANFKAQSFKKIKTPLIYFRRHLESVLIDLAVAALLIYCTFADNLPDSIKQKHFNWYLK
jgi:hypothetical protein